MLGRHTDGHGKAILLMNKFNYNKRLYCLDSNYIFVFENVKLESVRGQMFGIKGELFDKINPFANIR